MTKKTMFLIPGLVLTFALNTFAAEMKVLGRDNVALQTRIDLIKNAKSEILIEYFEVAKDDFTLVGLGLLQEAARRGVKVKVIVDSMHSDVTRPQFAAMMNVLKAAGDTENFEIKVFNPMDNLNLPDQTYRNHDKLFVVDGKFAIIGGRNVSGSYFGHAEEGKANLRDIDVLTYGEEVSKNKVIQGQVHLSPVEYFKALWTKNPMVKARDLYESSQKALTENCYLKNQDLVDDCDRLQKAANANVQKAQAEISQAVATLNSNQGEPQKDKTWGVTAKAKSEAELRRDMRQVDVVFMYNDPNVTMKNVKNKLGLQLGSLLLKKEPKQITILTPYLFPTPETMSLLNKLVVENGTKMKIITNSLNSTDSTLVYAAYETVKPKLLAMNTDLYEYNGVGPKKNLPTILHAKVMLLDEDSANPTALIGSFNMDQRSTLINREIGLMITGKDVKALTQDLQSEINYIMEVTTKADGTAANTQKLMNMATPEKREQLIKDRTHPVLLIKGLNKHI